ncbi:major facilitator superfamily domain-containing protein [Lophiotrema nucula]|uniref:Major facilitator superfamily domain-containing protein n=1 Tax=Lophiotrema nucula TaxID=690887 RepID=A0A6A5Z7R8_9PLEO|nr:major facilitator superfamily domain-containing protein [Lophiotrema nucula]
MTNVSEKASDESLDSTYTAHTVPPPQSELPPQDGGLQAWIFLFGASIVEAVTWGFPFCFGVFRDYYFTHPPFEGDGSLAIVGVMSNGCLQIWIPFLLQLLYKRPQYVRPMMWIGLAICVVSSIGGAFSRKPYQMILTQGALYGTGAGFLFAPILVLMSEWFDKRKSFAYGVMCADIGIGGTFLPTVYSKLLHRYGYRTTLLGWAVAVLVFTTPALLCIRHRVPPAARSEATAPRASNFSFFLKPSFYLLGASVFIQGMMVDLPGTYLPSFATDLQLNPTQGALALSMLNLATATGQISFGLFADWSGSFYPSLFLSTILSGLASLLIWGWSSIIASLIIFALIYGFSAGGYAVLRGRFSATVVGNEHDVSQGLMIFGVYTGIRGLGNIASGFVGTALVDERVQAQRGYAWKKWVPLVVFIGLGMFVAAVLGGAQYLVQVLNDRKRNQDSSAEDVHLDNIEQGLSDNS